MAAMNSTTNRIFIDLPEQLRHLKDCEEDIDKFDIEWRVDRTKASPSFGLKVPEATYMKYINHEGNTCFLDISDLSLEQHRRLAYNMGITTCGSATRIYCRQELGGKIATINRCKEEGKKPLESYNSYPVYQKKMKQLFKARSQVKEMIRLHGGVTDGKDVFYFIDSIMHNVPGSFTAHAVYYFYMRCEEKSEIDDNFYPFQGPASVYSEYPDADMQYDAVVSLSTTKGEETYALNGAIVNNTTGKGGIESNVNPIRLVSNQTTDQVHIVSPVNAAPKIGCAVVNANCAKEIPGRGNVVEMQKENIAFQPEVVNAQNMDEMVIIGSQHLDEQFPIADCAKLQDIPNETEPIKFDNSG
jgi:hypothetical protein